MSDKFRNNVPVQVTFSSGEVPTAAKLNAIGAQLKRSSTELEEAIGDIHGDNWPYSSSSNTQLTSPWGRSLTADTALTNAVDRALDIVNLGRIIGPASNLNPRAFGTRTVTETIPVGKNNFMLKYPVADTGTVVITETSPTAFITLGITTGAAGEYYIRTSGEVICTTPTISGTTIQYEVDFDSLAGGPGYQGSTFNVIPDPNQISSGGNGVTVGAPDGSGNRIITLPTVTAQQSNTDGDSILLSAEDVNYTGQLTLPKALVDNLANGDLIPGGFIYLKNFTTNVVYTEGTYWYINSTSFKFGGVDITDEVNAGNDFGVITVGTDITTAIDDLRMKFMLHEHNRAFGEKAVHVLSLYGAKDQNSQQGDSYVDYGGLFGNFAPQYLHRDGYQQGDNFFNGIFLVRGSGNIGVFEEGFSTNKEGGLETSEVIKCYARVIPNGITTPGSFPGQSNTVDLPDELNNVDIISISGTLEMNGGTFKQIGGGYSSDSYFLIGAKGLGRGIQIQFGADSDFQTVATQYDLTYIIWYKA